MLPLIGAKLSISDSDSATIIVGASLTEENAFVHKAEFVRLGLFYTKWENCGLIPCFSRSVFSTSCSFSAASFCFYNSGVFLNIV